MHPQNHPQFGEVFAKAHVVLPAVWLVSLVLRVPPAFGQQVLQAFDQLLPQVFVQYGHRDQPDQSGLQAPHRFVRVFPNQFVLALDLLVLNRFDLLALQAWEGPRETFGRHLRAVRRLFAQ